MDASGLIFAVLVVACLFYVVPRQLSWRIPTQKEAEQQTPLRLMMKTVHAGVPMADPASPEQDAAELAPVSTMLMRRAGRRAAFRLAREAENRRRIVFAALLVVCAATVPFAVIGLWLRWWVPLVALAVVGLWVVYSRFEARRAQRQLDAIVADTELGDDEKTIAVELPTTQQVVVTEDSLPIVGPNGDVQMSLWEPITVVPATYISAPTAARTVRTIDLSATSTKVPVTDDWVDGQESSSRAVAV